MKGVWVRAGEDPVGHALQLRVLDAPEAFRLAPDPLHRCVLEERRTQRTDDGSSRQRRNNSMPRRSRSRPQERQQVPQRGEEQSVKTAKEGFLVRCAPTVKVGLAVLVRRLDAVHGNELVVRGAVLRSYLCKREASNG